MAVRNSSFYLSKHTFFCLADEHYVFLDLHNDEYLCLGREQTKVFKELLSGHSLTDDGSTVIQTLMDKELFVADETEGKQPLPLNTDVAETSLITGTDDPRPAIGPTHIYKFFAAATVASWNLRWHSIEHTVRQVERRKRRRGNTLLPVDSATITDLFRIFQTLRPYYPRPYLCLFDSLALLHFLARFDVFPQWVYGVKLEPWGAHCWVQSGDLVVNDIVDNVNSYTPIMSI